MITTPEQSIIELFKTTKGAISLHEFFAISWLAEQSPSGIAFDLGTNAGKAAIAQASGFARQQRPRKLHCIDTVFDLGNDDAWSENKMQPNRMTTGWTWIHEPGFHDKVKDGITKASGGMVTAQLIGDRVLKAIPEHGKPGVAWAFCDADNGNEELTHGIVQKLVPNMVSGGIIAHHDFQGQMFFPHESQEWALKSGGFERIDIPWDEIKVAVDSIGGDHGENDSWHHRETERPMFVGAIRKL